MAGWRILTPSPQVAGAALAHDEAMHWAGVAQRELEDFDHQALPVDLLRQVGAACLMAVGACVFP